MNTNLTIKKETLTSAQTFTAACLGACEKLATQITLAKKNLVAEFKGAFQNHENLLQQAIVEADALAWQTEYPHLVFPLLATEKVQAATQWQSRQRRLLRTVPAYALAA